MTNTKIDNGDWCYRYNINDIACFVHDNNKIR